MEKQLDVLCGHVLSLIPGRTDRLLIGISGIPGSGKSTLARLLTALINERSKPGTAMMLPMDGFHLYRHQLDALPNAEEAHQRRGAPWTFWPEGLLDVVRALRKGTETVVAPGFDHKKKDPVEGEYVIGAGVRVVVLEGNYLALDAPIWREISALMDERWFVDADIEVAKARLARRHVEAGICADHEAGLRRAVENDIPNGLELVRNQTSIDRVIRSLDEGEWVQERERLLGAGTSEEEKE